MIDIEIKKALENAINEGDAPIGERFGCVISKSTAKEILDFINRQQAEIERLNRITDDLVKIADTRKKANFSLLKEKILLTRELKSAKSEAIKEFAERLQSRCIRQEGCLWSSDIGAELEEMVGDAE